MFIVTEYAALSLSSFILLFFPYVFRKMENTIEKIGAPSALCCKSVIVFTITIKCYVYDYLVPGMNVIEFIHIYHCAVKSKKQITNTIKPVLSGHSKNDKTKILMKNRNLMKVISIAECSPWGILQYFDLH